MRVLVACEFSGTVRDAFRARGHDAVSCDVLETKKPGPHIRADVRDVLNDGWDLMIAHPPCTYLALSGLHWKNRVPGRRLLTAAALDFVRLLLAAPIQRIALENPVGCISTHVRPPAQFIQPWQFGEPYSKLTCLWLKNLPRLRPTLILTPEAHQDNGCPRWRNQTATGQNQLPPSEDRWALRSVTYQGIADAMADQWGNAEHWRDPQRCLEFTA